VCELEKTESEKNNFKLFLRMNFSFEAKIFGQATLKGFHKEIPLEEQKARRKSKKTVYKHFVNLDPKTIEIFPRHPTKKEISKKLKKTLVH
jgi:hypothetical protein